MVFILLIFHLLFYSFTAFYIVFYYSVLECHIYYLEFSKEKIKRVKTYSFTRLLKPQWYFLVRSTGTSKCSFTFNSVLSLLLNLPALRVCHQL